MKHLHAWLLRLAGLFNKQRRDRELDDELETHLLMQVDANISLGMTPRDARRKALIRLGSLESIKERCRERSALPLVESLIQDLRYSCRLLRRSPGFTFTALASLALGIGANSAIFAIANAALWRTLPVADAQSIVLFSGVRENGRETNYLPTLMADALRRSTEVFSDVITRDDDGLSFSFEGGRAERVVGEVVSPNYFSFLGVNPLLGQGFSEDVKSGHWAAQVVLSHRFWEQRFGGNPGVLGKTVQLNGYPFTIVGVTPAGFSGLVVGFDPELRLALLPQGQTLGQMQLASNRNADIAARLRPGITIARARAATDSSFEQFNHDNPSLERFTNPLRRLNIRSGNKGWQDQLVEFRQPLLVLLALAGLVLLIACTNLANMLMARATARERELSIRAAIIGQQIRIGNDRGPQSEVVGIVSDASLWNLRKQDSPEAYIPILQGYSEWSELIIWFDGAPAGLADSVNREVQKLGQEYAFHLSTLASQAADSIMEERLIVTLSGFFGALSVLLAAIGLYGLVSYAITRRTREIGIRMALGAQRRDILRIVLRETVILVLSGVAIGLPVALLAARLIGHLLFGVSASDPITLSIVALVLIATGLAAGYLPARRASRSDPLAALRYE